MNSTVTKWWHLIALLSLLSACGGHTPAPKRDMKTFVVQSTTLHKTLFFTGTIQPLQEYPLTSPMDAVVESMRYHYGQFIKKDQIVFTLNSAELQKQYNDTLTEFLKAKDSYSIARAKFIGTEDLWKEGLLPKNNYLSEKSSLNNSRITLMQATRKMAEMLEKMGEGAELHLSDLSFTEFDKVRRALSGKHNLIHIKSPSNGVLLYPPKVTDDKSGRITVGSAVKTGQVLALMGNLSGIRVEIDVPEVDIDKIKPGMPAIVRGIAFAKQELRGQLVSVNAQASPGNGGALPSFTAIIEVKKLEAAQQPLIKVGMSASIELAVDSTDKLIVPIIALKQYRGQSVVHVRLPNGKISVRSVVTGPAHADSVVIESGLKVGDVVAYD